MSWPEAFDNLQDALTAAANTQGPDVIKVAQGTYKPGTSEFDTFELFDELRVEGGYIGWDDQDPDQRDIELYETILSGDLGSSSYSNNIVTIALDVTDATLLEGFTIRDGEGSFGAGILCTGTGLNPCWPVIRACTFINNTALDSGRGGGAIYCLDTDGETTEDFLEIRNCSFTGNEARNSGSGGAVMIDGVNGRCQVALLNCTIESNDVIGEAACGGGVHIDTDVSSEVHVVSCTISDNTAEFRGGGLSTKIHVEATDVFLVNSVIAGNSADDSGGGIYNNGADTEITNCTFSDNDALEDGGGHFERVGDFGSTSSSIVNSIFWGNTAGGSGHEIYNAGTLSISYSIVEGGCADISGFEPGYAGTNFDIDPCFVDPGMGDYRLMGGSPAIDRGDNAVLPDDQFDVDEDLEPDEKTPDRDLNDRIVTAAQFVVDRGAFEKADCFCLGDLDCNEVIGLSDLLTVLARWGDCPSLPEDGCEEEPDPCIADVDRNGVVGLSDLLAILGNWDACPCSEASAPNSVEDELENHGLTISDWEEFEGVLENGTQAAQENYLCWVNHYFACHAPQETCNPPSCPDDDPFGGH